MAGHTGLYYNTSFNQLLAPAVRTAAVNSAALDLQNFDSAAILFSVGAPGDTLSGANRYELQVQESPDGSTWTAVADTDLTHVVSGGVATGTVAIINANGLGNGVYFTGYKGNLRYVRGVIYVAGTLTNGTPIDVIGLAARPRLGPVNN